jgi:hypothetical protein
MRDLIITLTISWSSHFVLPRLRTWLTIVFVTPLVLLSLKLEHNIMSIGISCVCYT